MAIRQIMTRRNPNARGFIVRALERDDSTLMHDAKGDLVQSTWRTLEAVECGTKRKADRVHADLAAIWIK